MHCQTIVLGAGIVGVCTALHLQARGVEVILIDRQPPGNGTSHGNAGLIERSSVIPYAFPRELSSLVRYSLNQQSDVRYSWRYLPKVAPWLFTYWQNSSPTRLNQAARAMLPLVQRCVDEHDALIEAGGDHGVGDAGQQVRLVLELLLHAKKLTGLPIVTEIMDLSQLPMFSEVDVIQVGARNSQNFTLLKELGRTKKPILLKRGMAMSLKELLMSAEYVMAGGNDNVILCERGIRTFETATRNTLDLSAIPVLKNKTHLPVIVDPTHATGLKWCVEAMSKAAVAAGADGLMIEVHNKPEEALCDGEQAITPEEFDGIMKKIARYAELEGKSL